MDSCCALQPPLHSPGAQCRALPTTECTPHCTSVFGQGAHRANAALHPDCCPPACFPPGQVLAGIVDQLKPEDSLGVVLFSDGACTPRALTAMKGADVQELKRRVGGSWCVVQL